MRISRAYVFFAVALLAAAHSGRLLAADPAPLLDVAKGQRTNDSGKDDPNTKVEIAKSDELGGNALKVEFGSGDAVGVKSVKVKNWKPFSHLSFNVFNPSDEDVLIIFNVAHGKTKGFETRIAHELPLKAGLNEIRVPLEELKNTDGSDPDFATIVRWFIGVEEEQTPTLFFSTIQLDGGEGPAAGEAPPEKVVGAPKTTPKTTAKPGTAPAAGGGKGSFKIKGTINGQEVDLTITPDNASVDSDFSGEEGSLSVSPERVVEAVVAATQSAPTASAPTQSAPTQSTATQSTATARPKTKLPPIDKVINFDTPEADAVMSALQFFPANSAWHLDVSKFPLHPKSKTLVANVGADKVFRCNYDMAYSIVPPTQKTAAVKIFEAPDESDHGPFPIPANLPIEGWPVEFKGKGLTLDAVQRNTHEDEEGDRHAIIVDPTNGKLHEFFKMKKTGATWEAASAATFDLRSNKMRPDEWTSADAAGLPILAGVVRHDELKRGVIDHALRVTIRKSRKEYVYPATHQAGHTDDENVMRMGERLRLRANFDISKFTPEAQTILKALKKHGMLVADNGIEWAVSIAPDVRIPQLHAELRKVKGGDFEVVEFPKGYKPPE